MSDAFKSGFYGVVAVLLPVTAGHAGLGDELSLGGIQDTAVFSKDRTVSMRITRWTCSFFLQKARPRGWL